MHHSSSSTCLKIQQGTQLDKRALKTGTHIWILLQNGQVERIGEGQPGQVGQHELASQRVDLVEGCRGQGSSRQHTCISTSLWLWSAAVRCTLLDTASQGTFTSWTDAIDAQDQAVKSLQLLAAKRC